MPGEMMVKQTLSSDPDDNTRITKAYLEPDRLYAYGHALPPLLILGALLEVSRHLDHPLAVLGLTVLIGLALYRIYFPLHDCSHYSLFPTRVENRLFGHLLAGTLATPFDGFREEHVDHHRLYGTEQDPGGSDYFVRFHSRGELIRFLLYPLIGGTLLNKVRDNWHATLSRLHALVARRRPERRDEAGCPAPSTTGSSLANSDGRRHRVLFGIAVVLLVQGGLAFHVTNGFVELWRYPTLIILPGVTIFLFLSRVRMFLEHGSLDYTRLNYLAEPRPFARTIRARFPETLLFTGLNFQYHYEHHAYPAVPAKYLPRLHRELTAARMPPDALASGYLAALGEIWRNLKPASSA